MSNVSIYKFEDTTEIRVVEIEGNPWFVAADICKALGYTNPSVMVQPLDQRDKAKKFLGSGAPAITISEPGMYQILMRTQRTNPIAVRFQDWVTRDVLPAIRKDGAYIMGEEKVATGEMDEDAFVLKAIEILQRKIDRLKAENDAMSQELNVLTVDEYRALTHRYFTHSQKVKLGQAAARILRAQGQEPQRQERTVRFHGEERTVRVNLYPRAALEQAERELAA
ncbi:hypothetical protein IRZ59_10440 [Pseudomonas guariconensis]|uniref:BRO-N domain-containing protein n=1 Tax=Pseudomonas guariconensis TaxID=1288410 RepID=UPI0018AC829D|nr:BRO family protein [Pseudomonas guariconensis]MBF8730861.1 hypothetical protein [Pseudomonas guariconensis]